MQIDVASSLEFIFQFVQDKKTIRCTLNMGITRMRDMARVFHVLGLFSLSLPMVRRSSEQTDGGTCWWPSVAFEPEKESRDDDAASFGECLDVAMVRIPC